MRTKAIYLARGLNLSGEKELLGLWIAQSEGAKFWLQVVTELKNRGVQDIFIVCVDGLKGFPEAIGTVYPKTAVQLCIIVQSWRRNWSRTMSFFYKTGKLLSTGLVLCSRIGCLFDN